MFFGRKSTAVGMKTETRHSINLRVLAGGHSSVAYQTFENISVMNLRGLANIRVWQITFGFHGITLNIYAQNVNSSPFWVVSQFEIVGENGGWGIVLDSRMVAFLKYCGKDNYRTIH